MSSLEHDGQKEPRNAQWAKYSRGL